jgi:hypothetical protein
VEGEICELALKPVAAVALAEVEAGLEISNGLVWPEPVDCEEDDTDEVSDLMASRATDAAPRANSMAELQTNAAYRGPSFHADRSANTVPARKS